MHMWKRIGTALLAVILSIGIIPVNVNAQQVNELQETQLYHLDLNPTGGSILDGADVSGDYDSITDIQLPDRTQMEKPGYEFSGWYDHPDFTGRPYDSIHLQDTTVLYAKWLERYYTFTIPDHMELKEGNEASVSVHTGGFFNDDRVDLSVISEQNYHLVNGDDAIPYALSKTDDGEITDGIIGSFHQDGTQNMYIQMDQTDRPVYAGTYSDTLTFHFALHESQYRITYVKDGGVFNDADFDENADFRAGVKLDFLPEMVKEDAVFIGWCYDENRTQYVQEDDILTENLTVYASYQDTKDLEVHRYDTFARAIVEAGNAKRFTVTVCSKNGNAIDELIIQNGIVVKNVSSTQSFEPFTYSLNLTGCYEIIPTDGWEEGADYRVVLQDDNLCFTGYDPTIREYDIHFEMPEVLNFTLNDKIRYISRNSISDLVVNGKPQNTIDIAVMTIGEDGNQTGSETTGSFSYGGNLSAGDQIAIYEGDVIPSLKDADNRDQAFSQQNISFLEVTATDGNTVYYRGAKVEDVMGTPDSLYVENANDIEIIRIEGTDHAYILQIPVEKLTYDATTEIEQELGLDQDTTVDPGDFIMWADENNTAVIYEIQTVSLENGIYTLSCITQTQEGMIDCMDVYQKEPVDGKVLLQGVDTGEFESGIEQQAIESGFVDEVAHEIAAMTLATDSYQELQKEMKAAFGTDLTMSMVSSSNILLEATGKAGKKAEVELTKVRAKLGTKLEHFNNVSGVRLALELDFTVKIHVNDNADIEILVTTKFEQEVRIDLSVKGKAIWKWKWIFPYIADYQLTASAELYEYTGFDFNTNFKTKEADEDDEESTSDKTLTKRQKTEKFCTQAAKELKQLMDTGTKFVTDNADITTHLEDLLEEDGLENGTKVSIAKSLGEQYADLLEDDADWCEIYSKKMWGQQIRILLIFVVELKLEFVVSGMMNVTLGISYWYENAKKYVYSLSVASGKVTSDTIDLVEEKYEFSAYAVGTIGIRAGVKFTFAVGIFTTKLASVGISAEVGGYVELWGYLYYYYRYSASAGRTSSSMGNLYLEIGVYLEIEFEAQAFAGTFVFNPTLVDVQWPLYTVGSIYSTLDFSYEQSDLEQIVMKKAVTTAGLPDNLFTMNCIHMKEGLDDGEYYQRTCQPQDQFNITLTNPAFTYDATKNRITVRPGNTKQQDGEMVITWIPQDGSFFTKPISRKISLHWDCYQDAYSITFDTTGGSLVSSIVEPYHTAIQEPENPVRAGYIFDGWLDENGNHVSVPSHMPSEDTTLYASWVPDLVSVTVLHYLETENGSYRLMESVRDQVINGNTYTAEVRSMIGYSTPDVQSRTITKGSDTVFTYYYPRNSYMMTFISQGEIVSSESQLYGTKTFIPNPVRPGYTFAGWDQDVPVKIPAEDMTFTAVWMADSCDYKVSHYLESVNGWKRSDVEYRKGKTDETVTALAKEYAGYTAKQSSVSGVVKADGSLVLRLYYELNPYPLTLINGEDITVMEKKTGFVLNDLPVPEKKGYDFTGWYVDQDCTTKAPEVMPEDSLTLYAGWKEVYAEYTVYHYIENLEGTYELMETEQLQALKDHEVTPDVRTYDGLSSPESVTVTVRLNEKNEVTYYYTRNTYHMVFKADGTQVADEIMKYGSVITAPEPLEKAGYQFTRWEPQIPDIVPDCDMTFTAVYTANTYGYQINHYVETLTGYILQDQETGVAQTDTLIQAQTKEYEGYVKPEVLPSAFIQPDQVTVLNVYYTLPLYTLTLHQDNGSNDRIFTKKRTSQITEVYTPDRIGYQFDGWFMDKLLTMPFDQDQTPTMESDLNLYAKWTAKDVNVTVRHLVQNIYDDGYTLQDEIVIRAPSDSLYIPERKEYEGMNLPEEQQIQVKTDGTSLVEYRYDRKTYVITVDADIGTEIRQINVRHGSALSLDQPEKEGYSFTGWYPSIPETVTGDMTFTAMYQIRSYTLTFKGYEGVIEQKEYDFGAPVVYPDIPSRHGYTSYWNQVMTTMPAEDTDIELVYDVIHYSILYDFNGGMPETDVIYTYHIESDTIVLPRIRKTGFTFIGWSGTDIEETELQPEIQSGSTGDRSYRAEFVENEYTIRFVAGDGASGTMELMKPKYTETAVLPESGFTKTGYRMIGYSRNENATVPEYNVGDTISRMSDINNSTVIFYPVWQICTAVITIVSGVSDMEDQIIHVDYNRDVILPELSHPDYEFAGYSGSTTGTVSYRPNDCYHNSYETDTEIRLYARWLKKITEKDITAVKPDKDIDPKFTIQSDKPVKLHFEFGNPSDYMMNQEGFSSYHFGIGNVSKDIVQTLGKTRLTVTLSCHMESESVNQKLVYFTKRAGGEWSAMMNEEGVSNVTLSQTDFGDQEYTWSFPFDPASAPDMICLQIHGDNTWIMDNVVVRFSFEKGCTE